eukprot:6205789-Pleurochrysis_carterae.AAC.1
MADPEGKTPVLTDFTFKQIFHVLITGGAATRARTPYGRAFACSLTRSPAHSFARSDAGSTARSRVRFLTHSALA